MLGLCLRSQGCAVARELVCGAGTCQCDWYQPGSVRRAFARTGGDSDRAACPAAGTRCAAIPDPGSARLRCSYWSELGCSGEAGPLCGFWLSKAFRFSLGEAPGVLAGLLLLCGPPPSPGAAAFAAGSLRLGRAGDFS